MRLFELALQASPLIRNIGDVLFFDDKVLRLNYHKDAILVSKGIFTKTFTATEMYEALTYFLKREFVTKMPLSLGWEEVRLFVTVPQFHDNEYKLFAKTNGAGYSNTGFPDAEILVREMYHGKLRKDTFQAWLEKKCVLSRSSQTVTRTAP